VAALLGRTRARLTFDRLRPDFCPRIESGLAELEDGNKFGSMKCQDVRIFVEDDQVPTKLPLGDTAAFGFLQRSLSADLTSPMGCVTRHLIHLALFDVGKCGHIQAVSGSIVAFTCR